MLLNTIMQNCILIETVIVTIGHTKLNFDNDYCLKDKLLLVVVYATLTICQVT